MLFLPPFARRHTRPEVVNKLFNILKLFTFDIDLFRPECALGGGVTFYVIWLMKMSLPWIFAIAFLLGIGLLFLYSWIYKQDVGAGSWNSDFPVKEWRCCCPPMPRHRRHFYLNAFANGYLTLLSLLYLMLLSAVVDMWIWVTDEDASGSNERNTYLEADPGPFVWSKGFHLVRGS